MEQYYGVKLPRSFQRDFLSVVKAETDRNEMELMPQQVFDLFDENYINVMAPYSLESFSEHSMSNNVSRVDAVISYNDKKHEISAEGNGLLDAFTKAFSDLTGVKFHIAMYSEHALRKGSDSAAITYIELKNHEDGKIYIGAGVSSSVTKSSVRAIISAYNRMIK